MASVTSLGNGCCRACLGYWAVPHNVIVILPWLWSFLCKGVKGVCCLFLPVVVGSTACTSQSLVLQKWRVPWCSQEIRKMTKCFFLWTAKPVGEAVTQAIPSCPLGYESPLWMTVQQCGLHILLWPLCPLWFGKSAFSPDYFIKGSLGCRHTWSREMVEQ